METTPASFPGPPVILVAGGTDAVVCSSTEQTSPHSTGHGKRILSFDVGIRHLAFCHIVCRQPWQTKSCEITQWNVMDLGPVSNVESCASKLTLQLSTRFPPGCADIVLIERQPKSRSIIMVAVQMFLCAYFSQPSMHIPHVKFIHASWKLLMQEKPADSIVPSRAAARATCPKTSGAAEQKTVKRAQYAKNKKDAIATARHYLENVLQDLGSLVILNTITKKDDLSDCLLQALAFIEEGGQVRHSTYSRRRPRNPNPNPLL